MRVSVYVTDARKLGEMDKGNDICPYDISFDSRAGPADSLDSLESGKLLLKVVLYGSDDQSRAKKVTASLVNRVKEENLNKIDDHNMLRGKTRISTDLVQDSQQVNSWIGELSIPVSWIEGGTNDYSKSGSWRPKSGEELFVLEITYRFNDGVACGAHFTSGDAFHWNSVLQTKCRPVYSISPSSA